MGFIILDLEGLTLTKEETEMLKHPAVVGVILFTRNFHSHHQLRSLTQSIHKIRNNLLITVDQEGGRVQRFVDGFTAMGSQRHWGKLIEENEESAKIQLTQTLSQVLHELQSAGINFNLIPVLDIDHQMNRVIGDRSFSSSANVVIKGGEIVCDIVHAANMPTVGKHFPGHGGVAHDSHTTLPVDTREKTLIINNDLNIFLKLIHKLDAIMAAHVIYSSIDSMPATFSRFWLETTLRQQNQFNGIIMSDDLSMAAAESVAKCPVDRTLLALEAGCDITLLCNHRKNVVSVLDNMTEHPKPQSRQRIAAFIRKFAAAPAR